LRWDTVSFLGWFGPRGIASILFALLVLEHAGLAVGDEILAVVIVTVALSILAHGVTAYPGALWYARRLEHEASEMAEHAQVAEMPVRLPHRSS
jgi:NhaP-type Na+/H+ or K+/H+ antiporter